MTTKSQTVSIRLLREGKQPADSCRAGVAPTSWNSPDGAPIVLDTVVGGAGEQS